MRSIASTVLAAGLLAAVPAARAAEGEECTRLEAAHAGLLRSSFSTRRSFSVTLNGDLKMREMSRLTYTDGELSRELIAREMLDDRLVLEEGDDESSLALPFACERIQETAEGGYELTSADGTESVIFIMSEAAGALRPVAWRSSERTRLLWKKLEIEALAEYLDFEWR